MPFRKTMNVSLTPELERFVVGRVATGRYGSASAVVRAALRLLERDECVMSRRPAPVDRDFAL
ncbi:type II toxin-antitoxin system ParD family antitoxin [Azospirillum melinis]|uniref:type II toxin-antitoxin system ParD family antitoxin n=1 Tax=Azospirillum melinis TaxID=328839 RepID=UPI0037571580